MSAFRLSVAEILGHPGRLQEFEISGVLAGITNPLGGISTRPVVADLRAESVVEGILVTGTVSARADMSCARCLEPLESDLSLSVCELFAGAGHEPPPDEDAYEVQGLEVDLAPMLRDALALALPLSPVCSEGCAGLCGRCGQNLNEGACGCSDEEVDPRWAGLEQVREKLG